MDITLERILSLLQKDEDGKIVRGAKKEFAVSIGYDGGDIFSMWIKGTSNSYLKKLHEIATVYIAMNEREELLQLITEYPEICGPLLRLWRSQEVPHDPQAQENCTTP